VVPPRSVDRHIARDLDTVVMKCLERDPARRYRDAGELLAELQRYLDKEPVLAKPLGRLSTLMRWARQQPGLATTWAALVLFYLYHLYCFWILRPPHLGLGFHYISTSVVVVWALGAWGFQRALLVSGGRAVYLYLWVTLDVVLLTALLGATTGAKSSIVLIYHVLVAGSVLRFRPDLVGYVTLLSLAGYLFHVARAWWFVPAQLPTAMEAIPFILSLLMIGLIQYFALRRSRAAYELLSLARISKPTETD
jgi:serine/threonine-protein kinase